MLYILLVLVLNDYLVVVDRISFVKRAYGNVCD